MEKLWPMGPMTALMHPASNLVVVRFDLVMIQIQKICRLRFTIGSNCQFSHLKAFNQGRGRFVLWCSCTRKASERIIVRK